MPLWRCPHCATPQAETARCWVCHRSSTACGACRHFRRAVAGQLGYCGLDRQREPLRGDEIRPCWEAADSAGASPAPLPGIGAAWPMPPTDERTDVRSLQFVEVAPRPPLVGHVRRRGDAAKAGDVQPTDEAAPSAATQGPNEPRWSLWGEAEA